MNSKHTVDFYKNIVDKLRNKRSDIALSSDFIVGYPNESEKLFHETYSFLKELEISYLHVFSYSDRKNTLSEKMNSIVKVEDKIRRRKLLQKLSDIKYNKFINQNVSQVKEVLFENYNEGIIDGFSDNYIRVYAKGDIQLLNSIKKVKILKNDINTYGQIIN